VWQSLYEELKDLDFMLVAVAQDSRGAQQTRPWIEQAKASYWTLIDVEHRLCDLYGMVNVPQAVWIDEQGRIARPAETAGSTDHFRRMDRKTRQYEPSALAARKAAHNAYMDAVRAWVRTGANALDARAVAHKQPRISPEVAQAQAHFRLGAWLRRSGRVAEADTHLHEASRLHPDSWCLWRQAADLDEIGKAASAEFWARVDALGDRPYYPPPEVPGFGPA
jgi:hypothetical protein